jgi:phosphatidylglycerophosphatase A
MSQRPTPRFKELLQKPVHLLAFGLGSGLAPKAPGTAGTVLAIPLYLLLMQLSLPLYLAVVIAVSLLGIWICDVAARETGVHDHPGIVWDEWAGYLLTMAAAPAGWVWVLAGFVLFRLFDILKPWPIRWADQRVGGGVGIMLDDVIAGGFAWLCLQGLVILI